MLQPLATSTPPLGMRERDVREEETLAVISIIAYCHAWRTCRSGFPIATCYKRS